MSQSDPLAETDTAPESEPTETSAEAGTADGADSSTEDDSPERDDRTGQSEPPAAEPDPSAPPREWSPPDPTEFDDSGTAPDGETQQATERATADDVDESTASFGAVDAGTGSDGSTDDAFQTAPTEESTAGADESETFETAVDDGGSPHPDPPDEAGTDTLEPEPINDSESFDADETDPFVSDPGEPTGESRPGSSDGTESEDGDPLSDRLDDERS
ncbi:hypothetical protein ACFQL1_17840 [Halomicroarcula sp. GCM10025709]|uniref:hypothetical protein n=1 Tax=Halomicroarcula sp. GCM10025709 TaxID=3252669 RepID=UPI00360F9450